MRRLRSNRCLSRLTCPIPPCLTQETTAAPAGQRPFPVLQTSRKHQESGLGDRDRRLGAACLTPGIPVAVDGASLLLGPAPTPSMPRSRSIRVKSITLRRCERPTLRMTAWLARRHIGYSAHSIQNGGGSVRVQHSCPPMSLGADHDPRRDRLSNGSRIDYKRSGRSSLRGRGPLNPKKNAGRVEVIVDGRRKVELQRGCHCESDDRSRSYSCARALLEFMGLRGFEKA